MSTSYLLTRRGPITTLPLPGESKSQYVPHAFQLPNGDLWFVVKGDESRAIHAYRSTDAGVTWSHQGIVIGPTGGSNWDGGMCKDPVAVYDASTDTVHYYWKGNPDPLAGYGGWSVGHGTAPGSNPLALTRGPANPVLTPATVLAFAQAYWSLGVTSIGDLYLADVIRDPWNILTFFGGFRDQAGIYRIFRCRGDWNDVSPRQEGLISPVSPYTFVQAQTVWKEGGTYKTIFTEGHDTGAAGALHQTSASCPADGNWAWARNPATFLHNGPAGAWDGYQAYAAALLKGGPKYDAPILINGKLQLFYSGQPTPPPYIAQAGIADLDSGGGELAVIG